MINPPPTDEQTLILDNANSGNMMINALAGTGKTTTLEMLQEVVNERPILYLAFNKKIANEAEKKFPSTTTVRTFNGLGHRIWAKVNSTNLKLDPKKTHTIFRELTNAVPKSDQTIFWDSYWEVYQGVGLAKANGYVPDGKFPSARRLLSREAFHASLDEEPDELVAELIDEVLTQSIKLAYKGTIDFNDQIYMPALFGGTFPRFPLVKVDEYQDLNPVNHAMLDKLVKGRIIGVGDPWQSIYGFRGAKQGGMAEAVKAFEMTEYDLSVSFRCPEAIVRATHWRVPHFKWTNSGGHHGHWANPNLGGFAEGSAIICRNNAPLFRMALSLLSSGRPVSVAGSDIGPKLVALLRKLGSEDLPRSSVLSAIDDWLAERQAKNSASAPDMAACMRVFAEAGDTLGQAIGYAEHVLKQEGTLRLLTGHKSKGLEWDTVYHMDPGLIRIKDDEQEKNLKYVITTRAKQTCLEFFSDDIGE